MVIEPFVVDVPQTTLDDLAARLARMRWPDEVEDAGIPAILSRAPCPRSSTFRPPRAWLATGTAC